MVDQDLYDVNAISKVSVYDHDGCGLGLTISSTIWIARARPVAWNPIVSYDLIKSSKVIGFDRSGPLTWTELGGMASEGMSTLACAEVEDEASADIVVWGSVEWV